MCCLSLVVVVVLLVACRLSCLLVLLLYSSIVVPSSWPCWIYLYIGISSCRLSCLLSCLLVVALIVYCLALIYSCRLSCLLACRCFDSFRLSCLVLLSCLVTSLLAVAATGHGGHLVRYARPPTSGGDDFLIGGDRLPKPAPSPFLRTRSKKMRFFSAKRGKNGKNLRERKRD